LGDIRQAFRESGLRHTRQREAVYAALAATDAHPTAEELHDLVRRDEPGLSLATIYNSLEALSEAGLCRRLASNGGSTRFDADLSDHVHVILPDGRVMDVPSPLAKELLASVPTELVANLEAQTGIPIRGLGVQLVAFTRSDTQENPDS
jgi:Fe2+ or Zn2+ uptake regulation protein